jgi:hypothetical protein
MNQPFRSRPRVRPQVEPPKPGEEIVEGVIEEERALVPLDQPAAEGQQARPGYQGIQPVPRPAQRPAAKRVIHPGFLLAALGLLVGGMFFTLLNNADLPEVVDRWWPMVSLVIALIWSLSALARRNATSFLGGAAVTGLSISLLLHTQGVAQFRETFVGVTLISLGLAIVVRGLLLRQVSAA